MSTNAEIIAMQTADIQTLREERQELRERFAILSHDYACLRADARDLRTRAKVLEDELRQIIADLPAKRDWLDPVVERMARAALEAK